MALELGIFATRGHNWAILLLMLGFRKRMEYLIRDDAVLEQSCRNVFLQLRFLRKRYEMACKMSDKVFHRITRCDLLGSFLTVHAMHGNCKQTIV